MSLLWDGQREISCKVAKGGINMKKVVCLISGGLDSATVMGMMLAEGKVVIPRTFDYGQLHKREIESSRQVVSYYMDKFPEQVSPLEVVELSFLKTLGGSALTDQTLKVPTQREEKEMSKNIPITYVPGRNTILLSIALSIAEVKNADFIAIGVNAIDFSGYPDCRPEYIDSMNKIASLSSKRAVEGHPITILAPLLNMTKRQIILEGTELEVPYHLTWSCYQGGGKPCGECDSCKLRARGFEEARLKDPSLSS